MFDVIWPKQHAKHGTIFHEYHKNSAAFAFHQISFNWGKIQDNDDELRIMTNNDSIYNGILYASKMVINAKTGWYRLRIIFWHTDILVVDNGSIVFACVCFFFFFPSSQRNFWQINHRMSLSPSKFIIEWVNQPFLHWNHNKKHNDVSIIIIRNKNGKIRFLLIRSIFFACSSFYLIN